MPDLFARVAPFVTSALPGGRRDPRVTGMRRRRARVVVTAWVLCVIPLLTFSIGYLVLHLPAVDWALWSSAGQQAHLMTSAAAGHRYTMTAVDVIGIALLVLPFAGSLYSVTGPALVGRVSGPPSPGRRGRPGGYGGVRRLLDRAGSVPWLVTRPHPRPACPGRISLEGEFPCPLHLP